MDKAEQLRQENIKLRTDLIYYQQRLGMLETSFPYKWGVLFKSIAKNPFKLLISPFLFLKFFIDLVAAIIKRKFIPRIFRIINRISPPSKIAFVCNMGLVGGTERVLQMHAEFASEKYECEILFNKAEGQVAEDLKKKFKVKESEVLSYYLLRYKYIYLAQTFPNIRYIKEANPYVRISFILHDHLSGWLEAFQTHPDTLLFDHIFCISNLVRNKFLEKVPWFPEDKISVLYNPYFSGNQDPSIIKQREVDPEKFVLGYLGRISPEKNTIGLVRIFKRLNKKHPNTKLVIAGPIHKNIPEYGEQFMKEIEGDKSIEYIGPINGPDQINLKQFVEMIDGLAFTSFVEGIALTATEAMSYGLPVISTNVGAQNELIKEGENGMLVDIQPLNFNPFVELKPPFKFLPEIDEVSYLEALEKFISMKWNTKKIASDTIGIFGNEAAKRRLFEGIELILSREPISK